MDLSPELLTAAGAFIVTATGAFAKLVHEIRKTSPNGLRARMRRVEQRVALMAKEILGDKNPTDEQLDADATGEYEAL